MAEAGLDDFRVERRECAALPDCNGNGILDSDDIASGRSLDGNGNGVPDECGSPPVDRSKVRPNSKPPSGP